MDDLELRLVRCFSSVFPDLTADQAHNASVKSLANWDSLTAVTLAAVLQEEFGVPLNPMELSELESFQAMLNYIRTNQASFQEVHAPQDHLSPIRDRENSMHRDRSFDTPANKHIQEGVLVGVKNRFLQHLARNLPGSALRVNLHRARGVQIGKDVWMGYDVILETSCPHLVTIEDGATLSMRVTVIAHFKETQGVRIEQGAFVGPGAIILPNVVIGRGAVVTAGSVVTRSVPPLTLVQGNPAVPVAQCGIPLTSDVTLKEFSRRLTLLTADRPIAVGE